MSKYTSESSPIISVVLPVFNAEKYVSEAVASILSQTFSDFELIIINDGSSDGTLSVLQRHAEKDSRIRLVSRENRGVVASMNEGIQLSRGKWIARMDSDDISLPYRFERQLQLLAKTDSDICGGWVKLFGALESHVLKFPHSDEAIKTTILFESPFAHPTVMMKTNLLRQMQYDESYRKGSEDYDLWERAAQEGLRMTNVPEVVLLYRQHKAQMTSILLNDNQALAQNVRRRYWSFISKSIPLDKGWIDEVLKIREPIISTINIDYVGLAFASLLQHSDRKVYPVIFDQMAKLYFRIASVCPNVVANWDEVNKKYIGRSSFKVKLKLFLIRFFRIHPNSLSYIRLRNFYFTFKR